MENIYNDLAELLEVDMVNDADILADFESWDSLTVLSIIAYASENYNKTLLAKDVNDAETVGGLITIIKL